ncbi:105R [Tree shrew adenovirus 1]|uniref:105R n=1 Tax=Tree shrew adenovirus serotype 1 TaxID=47680 RepID=A0A2U9AGB0_ADET1|nr:105R [Tree shrew adenovirus 1]
MLLLFILLALAGPVAGNDAVEQPVTHLFAMPGDNLTFGVSEPQQASMYFWSLKRSWNEKYDRIASNRNCTVNTVVKVLYGRFYSCYGLTTLTNVVPTDAGTYRLRIRYNKTSDETYYFKLTVFEPQPVLVPLHFASNQLSLSCVDLKNNHSFVRIEEKREYSGSFEKISSSTGVLYTSYGHAENWQFRCCSNKFKLDYCSEWTTVTLSTIVSTGLAYGRDWCKYKKVTATSPKANSKYLSQDLKGKSECFRGYFTTGEKHLHGCQGKQAVIFSQEAGTWIKHRYIEGIKLIASRTHRIKINELTANWTGKYEVVVVNNSTPKKIGRREPFTLTVWPKMTIALNLVKLTLTEITLQCAHNLGPKVKTYWEVQGTYERHLENGTLLTLEPDCWDTRSWWLFNFAVRCYAVGNGWRGDSAWFTGNGQRMGEWSAFGAW